MLAALARPLSERSPFRHPVERGEPGRRGTFDAVAERASYFSSSPLFFLACVAMVLAWALGYVFGAGPRYEQVTATALTATTLLLLALLKNAELRGSAAMQHKLDAVATAMLQAIREENDRRAGELLERAIGIDEEL
ncbi:MAG TPA: low affinity iron permease family protein [Solirubrobacteraceae bacterium]|nr:low affinity iron permease family protein [Solirubrobacteraceae bacterium]